jgi:tetratricopeptide (TPR) repeat protein
MNAPFPRKFLSLCLTTTAIFVLAGPLLAVTQLTRGVAAPQIALKDLQGADVTTEKLRGKVLVVIFGELYHEKTRQACEQVQAARRDPRLDAASVVSILVVTRELTADEAKQNADAPAARLAQITLRDPTRQVYGVYEVAVMPSIVIIDGEGNVVHAIAGLTTRFTDLLTDSLLLATGKLSPQRFDEALNPAPGAPATAPATPDVRADRLAQLARQLARRGLDEMAAEKFHEALQLDPQNPSIHLDLGMLLLRRQRLADAESEFRQVLQSKPNSMQASLGLAFVQVTRGGGELDQAENSVRDLLARNPKEPRVHYLMGLINEQRGKSQDASASFKKAAQLLLEIGEGRSEGPGP